MKDEKKNVKNVEKESTAVELSVEDLDQVSGGSLRNAPKTGTQAISPGSKERL